MYKSKCKNCSKMFKHRSRHGKFCNRSCFSSKRTIKNRALCKVKNCKNFYRANGLCYMHYARNKRHGNPNTLTRKPPGSGTISHGYKIITIKGRKTFEHRLLMEEILGRRLTKDEVVHHIDKNRLNNSIENLKLMSRKKHDKLHGLSQRLNEKWSIKYSSCIVCKKNDSVHSSKGTCARCNERIRRQKKRRENNVRV